MLAKTEKTKAVHHYWEFADKLFVAHGKAYHGYCEHRSGCGEPQNSSLSPQCVKGQKYLTSTSINYI